MIFVLGLYYISCGDQISNYLVGYVGNTGVGAESNEYFGRKT